MDKDKQFQQHFIDLLDGRMVPFADSENEVATDGLTVTFTATEYVIRAYAYSDHIVNLATMGPIIIGKFRYSDTALEALTGVADIAQEFRRWRTMPGFNVPEIVFAVGERSFLKGRKYWDDADYISIYALYRVRGMNTNHEAYRRVISDSGTKAKFVGVKKPFLRKQKDFTKLNQGPFQVFAESAYKPFDYLPVDTNMVLAWFERRQKMVVNNKEECEAVGIQIVEGRVMQDNFLVLVPRDQMPLPLIFPHEWDV